MKKEARYIVEIARNYDGSMYYKAHRLKGETPTYDELDAMSPQSLRRIFVYAHASREAIAHCIYNLQNKCEDLILRTSRTGGSNA